MEQYVLGDWLFEITQAKNWSHVIKAAGNDVKPEFDFVIKSLPKRQLPTGADALLVHTPLKHHFLQNKVKII